MAALVGLPSGASFPSPLFAYGDYVGPLCAKSDIRTTPVWVWPTRGAAAENKAVRLVGEGRAFSRGAATRACAPPFKKAYTRSLKPLGVA